MFYLNPPDLAKTRADLVRFIATSIPDLHVEQP
jgi:hypothetical protein